MPAWLPRPTNIVTPFLRVESSIRKFLILIVFSVPFNSYLKIYMYSITRIGSFVNRYGLQTFKNKTGGIWIFFTW